MSTCPRCQSAIAATAIQCPQCGLTLKAHGHPGIPLHRTTDDRALCADCAYHADDSCTFPQRPHATTCTLYQSVTPSSEVYAPLKSPRVPWRWTLQRYGGWLALAALVGISLAIALS
jgi:hypothetical protein